MSKLHSLSSVAAAVAFAVILSTGCARFAESSAAGEVVSADAATTVVLQVANESSGPMELRTILDGRSKFVGSVGGNDTTSIVLDPMLFPTGSLYLSAIPASGIGRAIVGPLAATKGDKIKFSIQPALEMSHAIVVR
jgi:hypothetical protein